MSTRIIDQLYCLDKGLCERDGNRTETMYNFLLKNWLLGTWKKVLKAEQIFPFSMSEYLYYYIVKINSRANPNLIDLLAVGTNGIRLLFVFTGTGFCLHFPGGALLKHKLDHKKNTSGHLNVDKEFRFFYPRRLPNFWVIQRCAVDADFFWIFPNRKIIKYKEGNNCIQLI